MRALALRTAALLLAAAAPAAAADAVLCYGAHPAPGIPAFVRRQVLAIDVVDGERSLDVSAGRRMCVPVDLGTGVGAPSTGLRQYKAKRTRGSLPPSGEPDVDVTNVLGAMRLERKAKPVRLLAPAAFDPTTEPVPPAGGVDHYRCDEAKTVTGSVPATGAILDVTDGFGTTRLQILKPTMLCTPVDALGATIVDAETTLACFKARFSRNAAAGASLQVADAFGAGGVRLGSPAEICLPSRGIVRCNRHAALCDRGFDAVSYATTHNAMSNRDGGWLGPNQEHGITRRLEDGIRALMLDTWYFGGNVVLCHGADVLPCSFTGQQLLVDGLAEIEAFLARHPDEVVSIIFESYISEADTAAAFAASGLLARAHSQATGAPWPTLRTLLRSGKRLVVFTDRSESMLPWHHYVWSHAWETHYSAATPADLRCTINRGSYANPLFILNHFLTNLIGSPALAQQVNHDPFFTNRALQCRGESGRLPNFVTVDFYDIGDVFGVVDVLNGVGG